MAVTHRTASIIVPDAWSRRANLTVADALYVTLAQHLKAPLTDDHKLAGAPGLSIAVLRLSWRARPGFPVGTVMNHCFGSQMLRCGAGDAAVNGVPAWSQP